MGRLLASCCGDSTSGFSIQVSRGRASTTISLLSRTRTSRGEGVTSDPSKEYNITAGPTSSAFAHNPRSMLQLP